MQANPNCQHPSEALCTCKDVGDSTEDKTQFYRELAELLKRHGQPPIVRLKKSDKPEESKP